MNMHVSPVNDLVEHEGADCVCGPAVQAVQSVDGTNWLYIHHALGVRAAGADS